jgi:hypothetical protein
VLGGLTPRAGEHPHASGHYGAAQHARFPISAGTTDQAPGPREGPAPSGARTIRPLSDRGKRGTRGVGSATRPTISSQSSSAMRRWSRRDRRLERTAAARSSSARRVLLLPHRSTHPRCQAGVPSGLVTGTRRARTEAGLL